MIRYFCNRRGSSLTLVMVLLTVISILGVSMLSATLWGYKMKIFDNRGRMALYTAEAGIDEAYAYLGKEMENAVAYSREVHLNGILMAKPSWSVWDETVDYNTFQTTFNNELKKEFKIGFKNYFKMNEAQIKSTLEQSIRLRRSVPGSLPEEVPGPNHEMVSAVIATVGQSFDTPDKPKDDMIINVQSEVRGFYNLNKKTWKEGDNLAPNATDIISADFTITAPDYNTPFQQLMSNYQIHKNPLWEYALLSEGDLYVLGKNAVVDGNLFARGSNQDADGTFRLDDTMGGIIVGGTDTLTRAASIDVSGQLTVSGKAVTSRFLQTRFSTEADASTVSIGGSVYANSIVTQGGTDNTGSGITIGGNAFVEDDTQLDAKKSHVRIDGNYYGFSLGNGNIEHDKSSALVLNQDDFASENGSSLRIAGNTTEAPPTFLNKGTYLLGLVHVNQQLAYELVTPPTKGDVEFLNNVMYRYTPRAAQTGNDDIFTVRGRNLIDNSYTVDTVVTIKQRDTPTVGRLADDYQTGDSASVIGNYMGYGQVLSATGVPDSDLGMTGLGSDYFKDFVPLNLAVLKKDNILGTTTEMNFGDKSRYARYAQAQYESLFSLGKGKDGQAQISVGNVLGSLGNYISNLALNGPVGVESEYSVVNKIGARHFAWQTNYIGDSLVENDILNTSNISPYSAPMPLTSWLVLNGGNLPEISETRNTTVKNVTFQNDLFFSSNSTTPLILKGTLQGSDNAYLTQLKTKLGSSRELSLTPRGIILTWGPVYIIGQVDFTGMILSGGDIYLLGDSAKTFHGSDTASAEGFIPDRVFRDTKTDVAHTTGIGNLFLQDSRAEVLQRQFSVADFYNNGGGINATPQYSGSMRQYLKVSHWRKTKHIQ